MGATILSIMALGIMIFSVMTISITGLFGTLSINDIQHKRHSALQYCHFAECRVSFIVMLNIIMPSLVMDLGGKLK